MYCLTVYPNKVFLPFYNLTVIHYCNEYSVLWRIVNDALAAVFMIGKDNPFSSSSVNFRNETHQLAMCWVNAQKTRPKNTSVAPVKR